MRHAITIHTALPRDTLENRLAALTVGGPFRVPDLAHLGGGLWSFTLQPSRHGLAIGFGKVAELLLLLAREFEVEGVEWSSPGALAAAS